MPFYNLDIPPVRQVIFLNGRYFTEFDRPYSWKQEEDFGWQTTSPQAWICPKCLTVWAKIYEPSNLERTFGIVAEPCTSCGGDGSLLRMHPFYLVDPGLLDFGTEEFVKREFDVALDNLERK